MKGIVEMKKLKKDSKGEWKRKEKREVGNLKGKRRDWCNFMRKVKIRTLWVRNTFTDWASGPV